MKSRKKEYSLMCEMCSRKCRDKYALNRHLETHKKLNRYKVCQLCGSQIQYDLDKHLLDFHQIKVVSEIFSFSNISEFKEWKEDIERSTNSRYVKHHGPQKRRDGSSVVYYYCHRDGTYIPKGKNVRKVKLIGTNKINGACPASMKVDQSNESVTVLFKSTHIGHSCDINRMNLTKSEKETIAKQIAMKIPLSDILDGIRNAASENDLQRIHLLTKKDLRNISAGCSVENDESDTDSSEAVNKWVSYMNETSDIVRLFKPQGTAAPGIPELNADDFCLILSNRVQRDALEKFGNDILFIDSVDGLSDFDYQLLTILVFDETRSAYPCAFMFCNRVDTLVINLFFRAVISCLGSEISPKYFISDIDEMFINAWYTLYPNGETQHLYNFGRVNKSWQQNLIKIKNDEKKAEVYKKIIILMIQKNKISFHAMCKELLQEFYAGKLTEQFAVYFENFVLEHSKWACSYRVKGATYIDQSIEIIFKHLEHVCLAGKKTRKLITSIHALLKFLKDHIIQKSLECSLNSDKKRIFIKRRHETSLKLSLESVYPLSEDLWTVFGGVDVFIVSRAKKDCTCNLRCEACDACVHLFRCTCNDATVLSNMCKHIHLVLRATSTIQYHSSETDIDASSSENSVDAKTFTVVSPQATQEFDLEYNKRCEADNLLRIINGITTEAGFQAFKKFVEPLEDVIKRAECSVKTSVDFVCKKPCEEHSYSKYVNYGELVEIVTVGDVAESIEVTEEFILC